MQSCLQLIFFSVEQQMLHMAQSSIKKLETIHVRALNFFPLWTNDEARMHEVINRKDLERESETKMSNELSKYWNFKIAACCVPPSFALQKAQ